jgi:chaperonin GroES
MSLRPLHDRVIVKRLDQETKPRRASIPDSAAEKPDQGEVLAVGPGRRDNDGAASRPDLNVGDRVLFGKYAGQTVTATNCSCCAKKTSSQSFNPEGIDHGSERHRIRRHRP